MTQSAAPAYRLVRPPGDTPVAAPVLDSVQRRVVNNPAGPLLVLAGPGTGKTTTLVEAVAARVEAGVPVEHILMVTFSRRAAAEMRDRVTTRLGRTLREPLARTLHSYAFGVLRMAALARRQPPPRLLAGPEQDLILRQLIAGMPPQRWPESLRPALSTRAFAGQLRDLLLRAVERGLDGPSLTALGQARARPDWQAAGTFLQEYQEVTALAQPGGYDPAELIRAALAELEDDPALLAAERAARRHIFVDEYQDTDPAQQELLALLADGADELILVGDPDQSIYGFRGVDSAAMQDVDERFGRGGQPVPRVALSCCRRSGSALLAASRRLAERLPGPAAQRRLVAADGLPSGQVQVGLFRSLSEEASYLAGVLRRAHLDGMPWSRMAVLVRSTTAVLPALRRALDRAGVPVSVRGEDLPLAEQPAVAMLLEVLGCVLDGTALDEDAAERLLLGPIGGGDGIYLRRLRRVLRQLLAATGEPALLAPALLDPAGAPVLPEHVRTPVERVARVIAAGRDAVAESASPESVLWAIWHASGLAPRWERASRDGGVAGAAADRDLDAVVQLFDAAARFTDRLPAAEARAFAEYLSAQQIPADTLATGASGTDTVALLTAHASKGLEWDLVCLAHVQEGSWPDLRRRGSLLGCELLVDELAGRVTTHGVPDAVQLAEERRLFYVAVTRARERVIVTAVSGEEEQPSRFIDELDPLPGESAAERPMTEPQQGVHLRAMVAELRACVCDPAAAPPDRHAAAGELARLAAAGVAGADPQQWWGLAELSDDGPVADPDRPVPVSPSRLESFLRCELRSLLLGLGARDEDGLSASLGTLIHDIAATAPPEADLAEFERMLDQRWGELDFPAAWYAENERERARTMLARLAEWLHSSRGELDLLAREEEFSVVVGDAVLRGRVDRLERDRSGRLVVVDLKTGKTKPSRGEVPTNPQLAAYQLAVERAGFAGGAQSAGAMLVQLGSGGRDPQQRQAPLSESEDPEWISRQVGEVSARMRGSQFTAIAGVDCRRCDVRACCPLHDDGRQVTM